MMLNLLYTIMTVCFPRTGKRAVANGFALRAGLQEKPLPGAITNHKQKGEKR